MSDLWFLFLEPSVNDEFNFNTAYEAMPSLASCMYRGFAVAQDNLKKAKEEMRSQEESQRRQVESSEGDLVLLNIRRLRFC